MLSFTVLDNISNLFLIEMMFICPITTLFTLFIQIYFKISNGPSSQLLSIVLKISVGFIDFKSKPHFGHPTLFHNFLIVAMLFIASLDVPCSFKCRPLFPKSFLTVLKFFTSGIFNSFKFLFTFWTAFPLLGLSTHIVDVETVTSHILF